MVEHVVGFPYLTLTAGLFLFWAPEAREAHLTCRIMTQVVDLSLKLIEVDLSTTGLAAAAAAAPDYR